MNKQTKKYLKKTKIIQQNQNKSHEKLYEKSKKPQTGTFNNSMWEWK